MLTMMICRFGRQAAGPQGGSLYFIMSTRIRGGRRGQGRAPLASRRPHASRSVAAAARAYLLAVLYLVSRMLRANPMWCASQLLHIPHATPPHQTNTNLLDFAPPSLTKQAKWWPARFFRAPRRRWTTSGLSSCPLSRSRSRLTPSWASSSPLSVRPPPVSTRLWPRHCSVARQLALAFPRVEDGLHPSLQSLNTRRVGFDARLLFMESVKV